MSIYKWGFLRDILMTQQETTGQNEWTDCRGGEISGLVRRLKTQRTLSRRKQVVQSFSIAAGLLVVVGLGWLMLPGEPAPVEADYGGIVCSEVVKHSKQYVLHQLDPELAKKINAHLGQCENCRRKMTMLRERLGLGPAKRSTDSGRHAPVSATATVAATIIP